MRWRGKINMPKKNPHNIFKIKNEFLNVIILSFTLLSFILIEVVKTSFENSILPIPTWIIALSLISFILIIFLVGLIFWFSESSYFWKILTIFVLIGIYLTLIVNFTYIAPRSYTSYKFTCDLLNNSNLPIINFKLENFGKSISITHILLNLSNKNVKIMNENRDIDGNMVYTLTSNEKYDTFFVIELGKNYTGKLIINNNIDCKGFYCYIIGKSPTDRKCEYLFDKNIAQLSKE